MKSVYRFGGMPHQTQTSIKMGEDIKRWVAKRKTALGIEIIQVKHSLKGQSMMVFSCQRL